jgi:hypothetical protein
MKPARQLNQELFEYALNSNSQFKPQIAQIADEKSYVETIQNKKFTEDRVSQDGTGIILRRYKIRICSMHDDTTPIEDLPWAYGQSPTSGLGAASSPAPRYAANTFVTVFQDPDTGIYYIDDVHPNSVGILSTTKAPGCSAASGFTPGSALFYVPQTHYKENRLVNGAEWFNTPRPSEEDKKQNNLNKDLVLPSKCRKVDTEAINKEIENLLKDVQKLKQDLLGEDSFLQTSQKFINDVQGKVNEYSAKIANLTAWAIQELRRYVTRKINAGVGDVIGNAPLSQRYLINEVTKNQLSLVSCLFVKLLENLESIIAAILNAILDKILNTAECLIENIIGTILGQIISQLTAAINGILGPISSLIGSVISFTSEIFDFVESILDFLKCKVENVCPVTEKWNVLEGGQPPKVSLDFASILNSAKAVADNFVSAINIADNLDNFNFNIQPNLNLTDCFTGPESCGPPSVIFWGGSGSGAKGNAVLNAVGDIIGVDIIASGSYTSAPVITFEDNCGNGVGAYGTPILGITPTAGNGTTVAGGSSPGSPNNRGECDFSISEGYNGPGIYLDISDFPLDGRPLPFIVTMGDLEDDDTDYSITIPNLISLDTQNVTSGLAEVDPLSRLSLQNLSVLFSKQIPGEYIKSKSSQKIFGPIKSTGGTLYIGDEKVEGISNSGTLSNKHIVIENGGDDWDDYVYELNFAGKPSGYYEFAKFIRLSDCFGKESPSSPTGIGTTATGVKEVLMNKTGYNYLPYPNGSKGGMKRTFADRCQTIVRRANGNWDPAYSYKQPIKLFFGDMIQLPGRGEVYIDCDFDAKKLPGCSVTGTLTCLKSMVGFDDGKGGTVFDLANVKSMVGFDDLRGSSLENTPPISIEHQKRVDDLIKTTKAIEAYEREKVLVEQGKIVGQYRPDQFGFVNDYPYAKELGFSDQDIRFYLEGFYSKLLGKRIGPLMQVVLNDPNFGPLPKYLTGNGYWGVFDYENDYPYAVSLGFSDQDIRYYLENLYPGTIADDMQKKLNDSKWGKIPEFYVTITAPDCPPENPPSGNNYDVIPELGDDIHIEDGGFGFGPDDTATLLDCAGNPDAATKIELDIDQNGTIIKARVVQKGTNFTCIPEIRLNTKTGYNARLKPILKFTRAAEINVPPGTTVLSVVDCVGKV